MVKAYVRRAKEAISKLDPKKDKVKIFAIRYGMNPERAIQCQSK